MKLDLHKNELYIIYEFAYNDVASRVIILDDFNDACIEYVETMKLLKNSIKDKDYMMGYISVRMIKIKLFKNKFYEIHGFEPEITDVDEIEIFMNIKQFINFPPKKELQT